MSTPLSWIKGTFFGIKLGKRKELHTLYPGTKEYCRARQRLNFAHKVMRNAEKAEQHIAMCYEEIERLGGKIPKWE